MVHVCESMPPPKSLWNHGHVLVHNVSMNTTRVGRCQGNGSKGNARMRKCHRNEEGRKMKKDPVMGFSVRIIIFFVNFDEAQVAPWAADMAKVLLFIVNP